MRIEKNNRESTFRVLYWFIGGLSIAYAFISAGFAAVPQKFSPGVSEINANKAKTISIEHDYVKLTQLENQYAESWDQQLKLRKATQRVASRGTLTASKSSSQPPYRTSTPRKRTRR